MTLTFDRDLDSVEINQRPNIFVQRSFSSNAIVWTPHKRTPDRLLYLNHEVVGNETNWILTRHRASTSTRWHFAFRLCCHSNETRGPIANPPNSAQQTLRPGLCSSVGMRRGTDTHKRTYTHCRRAWPMYILRRLQVTRNAINVSS